MPVRWPDDFFSTILIRALALVDSSLHDLLETRFGPSFARLLGSALVHGIYAADSRAVSAQSAFGSLFYMARDGGGSVLRGALRHAFGDFVESQKAFRDAKPEVDYDSGDVANLMEHQNTSVFSFMDGLQALPSALEENLAQQPNIKIIREADVSSISARDRKQLFDIKVNNQASLYVRCQKALVESALSISLSRPHMLFLRCQHQVSTPFFPRPRSLHCYDLPSSLNLKNTSLQ